MKKIDPELLHRLLVCDPQTGKLWWRRRSADLFCSGKKTKEHICNGWNSRHAGREAFTSIAACGYKQGQIFGVHYYGHRIVWAMATGQWVRAQIDHINGDRCDNRIANLREVSTADNCRNSSMPSVNTTGFVGVYRLGQTERWRVAIGVEGTSVHVGCYDDLADAIQARKQAEREYGFHPNHGRAAR